MESRTVIPNAGVDVVGIQNGMATLEDSLAVSKKLNLLLPYDPTIMLLGICPKELKTYVHTKACTQMVIEL